MKSCAQKSTNRLKNLCVICAEGLQFMSFRRHFAAIFPQGANVRTAPKVKIILLQVPELDDQTADNDE